MNNEREIWNEIANNFQKNQKNSWFFYYLDEAYKKAINIGLNQLKLKDNANKKIKLLKTDLWNETIETKRDILANLNGDDNFEIYGIDISDEICHLGKKVLKNIKVVNCDIRRIPFVDKYFDVVLDISTIDHVPENDIVFVLKEYNRILKDGGVLILISWYRSFSVKYCLLPFMKYILRLNDENPQYYFTVKNLQGTVTKNFKILRLHYFGTLLCHPYIGKLLTFLHNRIYRKIFDMLLKLEFLTSLNFIFKHLGGLILFIGEKNEKTFY